MFGEQRNSADSLSSVAISVFGAVCWSNADVMPCSWTIFFRLKLNVYLTSLAFMGRTGWARTTLFTLVLEATWVSCCSSAVGTGGVTSHVTSVVIPSVLWGLQGCAKSVLRWEITRDSPDAAQGFAGDCWCFCLGVDMAPGLLEQLSINHSKSPVCCLSINYSILFKKKSQSQLLCAGGNWTWVAVLLP